MEILKSFPIHFAILTSQTEINKGIGHYRRHLGNPVLDFSFLAFSEISTSDFWFLIYDFWFLTCEFWILVSEFWFLISDFKYRVNYSLKIRYSIFINRKSELDYFHFVVFWILKSGKQVGRKASWLRFLTLNESLLMHMRLKSMLPSKGWITGQLGLVDSLAVKILKVDLRTSKTEDILRYFLHEV